jgi:ribosomal-protein-alanine N-acetyltransferase
MEHSSSNFLIRRAVPGDLGGITEVENLSFVHAGERFDNSRVNYLVVNPRCIVIVAMQGERLLGWSSGIVWLRGKEPWGRIYALAVHPQARGKRLGPRLLKDMIQLLRDRGAGRVFLEVRVDNDSAIRLYHAAGFRPCRLLKNYYGPEIPAQRMELPAGLDS